MFQLIELRLSLSGLVRQTLGFFISQSDLSWSLMKYGDRKPRSIVRPSVKSTSSPNVWLSSTTVDPVSPTCVIVSKHAARPSEEAHHTRTFAPGNMAHETALI